MDIFVNNSNEVYIKGFRLASDDTYKNDAILTFTVYDQWDAPVDGATSVSMSYESGSNGNYRGAFTASSKIALNEKYYIIISASNYDFEFVLKNLTAVQRS